jgi:hypothetical protein
MKSGEDLIVETPLPHLGATVRKASASYAGH